TLGLSLSLFLVRGVLPFNIGELVREISTHLTETWDQSRGIKRYERLNARATRFLLANLAYKLQKADMFVFRPHSLSGLLPLEYDQLPLSQVLEEIRTATGLLRCEADKWSFSHRYFQDFFCANF